MRLTSLELLNFRNYRSSKIVLPRKGALFAGLNGTGKTSLLEAIHVLATGRSQRGTHRRDLLTSGEREGFVEGVFESDKNPSTIVSMGIARNGRDILTIGGVQKRNLSDWFSKVPVMPFGPDDISLITGTPADRRRFVDIVLSQNDGSYLENLMRYRRALLNRNRLLAQRGSEKELEVFEYQMAYHGRHLMEQRVLFFESISGTFDSLYGRITPHGETVAIRFSPSIPREEEHVWEESLCRRLAEVRPRDRVLGHTSVGPHRDDFTCTIKGCSARVVGSQGQCRSLAITVRLCALGFFGKEKGREVIILVDDAFSELDRERTSRIYPLIVGQGQLFITSVSPEIGYAGDLERFEIVDGRVSEAETIEEIS